MNWKLLGLPTVCLVSGALLASACTIGEWTGDDDQGGAGGESSGGSSSGSGGQGGDSATGGQGGTTPPLDCVETGIPEGELASTAPSAGESSCQACVKELCPGEFSICNANSPVNSCRFGSTQFNGEAIEGEFDCMVACFNDDFAGDAEQLDDCADACGSVECADFSSTAQGPAKNLLSCMLNLSENNTNNADCIDECFDF